MILSGDIGATKTNIGLFSIEKGILDQKRLETLISSDYDGLVELINVFLNNPATRTVIHANGGQIGLACFGVAGPVHQNSVELTNLPWKSVIGDELAQKTGLPRVVLINDLIAMAWGINASGKKDFTALHPGKETPGENRALLAAGTGLGMALLPGGDTPPVPSEGGHMDFAARNDDEIGLFNFLVQRFGGHVSLERVVSGAGLRNIYDYIVEKGTEYENPDVRREMTCSDPARVISRAAIEGRCPLCMKALNMFAAAYGAAAGNLALVGTARSGVYLGGGMTPEIFAKLARIDNAFKEAFLDKGRFRAFLEEVPVRLIRNTEIAVLGAAYHATRLVV